MELSSGAEVSEPTLIRAELSVDIVSVLPGQPRTVAYRTVLFLFRVKRMSCAVPTFGAVKAPPPMCVGPSPYVVQARVE